MRRFPPVTLERLLRWAAANEVPEDALVNDDDGRMITTVRYDKPTDRIYLESAYLDPGDTTGYRPFTLMLFVQGISGTGAPDSAQLWHDGGRIFDDAPVIDLSGEGAAGPADDGNHYLTLQRRWG